MSTQPPTLDPAPKTLEELRTVLGQRRDNKGKPPKAMTSAEKDHWPRLVAAVFTDPDCPVDTLFQELSSFPPAVVAGGIASAWENMDEARRASYLSWLKSLDSQKAVSQKVVLIPALLDRFPSVSLELLCGLSLNQGVKNRLASAILGNTPEKVGLMITPDMPEWKARQALEQLCQISEGQKVGMKAKWEVLHLTLKTIVERKMHKDALSQGLIQHVEGQLPNLAPQFQERLRDLVKGLDPVLLERLFPAAAGTATVGARQETSPRRHEAVAQIVAADTPLVLPGTGTGTSAESSVQSNVLDRLAGWLDTLHGQATLLVDTRARILQLEQENQTVKAQLDAARVAEEGSRTSAQEAAAGQQQAQHRLQALEEKSREAQKALTASLANIRELESELHKVRERESQLGTKLRQRETEFTKEREDLQRRIKANADGRVQEFCNGLGSSLRRRLVRIPDRGTAVSAELGGVLLARLQDVIDELEAKGIKVRADREAVSQ